MKIFLSIFLTAFFFIVSQNGKAQISDSLYNGLPRDLKPANRLQLTTWEKQSILKDTADFIPSRFNAEIKELAEIVARETSLTTDRELKIYNTEALADYYYSTSRGKEASVFYSDIIKELVEKKDHSELLSRAYRNLGELYVYESKQDSAINYYHKALDIVKAANDSVAIRAVFESYSHLYYHLQLYGKAIYYNNKCLEYPEDEKWNAAYTKNFLNNSLFYTKIYDKTKEEKYADSAMKVIRTVMHEKKQDSLSWYGACYFFSGYLLFCRKEYSKALSFFDSSLVEKYRMNDEYYKEPSAKYFLRALCLIKTGDYATGKKLLDSTPVTGFSNLRWMNLVLYEHALSVGDWKSAFNYHNEFIRYSDSLKIIENNGAVFESEQKYTIAEKQAAITDLQNKNLLKEKERSKLINIAITGTLLLSIIIVVLYGLFRQSQFLGASERLGLTTELYRMETEMNDQRLLQQKMIADQRKKISQNIHDEISSGLAALRYRISHLKSKETDSGMKEVLNGLDEDALTLYLQSRDFMSNLAKNETADMGNYNVVELLQNLSARFDDEKVFQVITEYDEYNIARYFTGHMHYELYLVIKESVTNILKHANAGKVFIRIFFEKAVSNFIISDNGSGFDKHKINSGSGLKSIEQRIKNLKGNLEISSDNNGTFLKGSFPVAGIA